MCHMHFRDASKQILLPFDRIRLTVFPFIFMLSFMLAVASYLIGRYERVVLMFSSHSLKEVKSCVLEEVDIEAVTDCYTVLCSCTVTDDHILALLFVKYIQVNPFVRGAHHFFIALVKQLI